MTDTEKRVAVKKFVDYWKDKGYEKGESQPFWLSLLSSVFGVENAEQYIKFEDKVKLDHTSFIDGSIQKTHVLIEQKGVDKSLRKPIKQSDGTFLTPFEQAKRYATEQPYSKRPRWIVTCNFKEFLVYDMENPSKEPEEIQLINLPSEYYRLQFLVETDNCNIKKEMEISIRAGEIVGELYDKIINQYIDPANPESLKSLNMLCVRLVFCLYAEDAEIFGEHGKFHNYLQNFSSRDIRRALIDFFKVLDTQIEDRDPYLDPILASFPYVNGGLFSEENIEIPQFTDEIVSLLLHNASEGFDWSEISPTIFGAVFESTLNPETRRSGGMHYTSIENIHKVINPLFLANLQTELTKIKMIPVESKRSAELTLFQEKLAGLIFLDPACGSGNFLTETYLSLRHLENEVIRLLIDSRTATKKREKEKISSGQIAIGLDGQINPIKVSIGQFYGIEINDFAVSVAKTALWIAESQMMKQTEDVVHMNLDFLPLKTYANIHENNALRVDWDTVVHRSQLKYIMGNPPFIGARLMEQTQKDDMMLVFGKEKGVSNLDYVSTWYKKAAQYMQNSEVHAAFVSTNSITQGEQPSILWKPIMDSGVKIEFAYRTFKWNNETKDMAAVHCVIIGFSSNISVDKKHLYVNETIVQEVNNINAYLVDAPNVFIESRKKPLFDVPEMNFGSMPNDNGYLSDYSVEKKDEIIKLYPDSADMFRKFVGATEFLNNKDRWCLWLKDISPSKIKKIPPLMNAIRSVQKMRTESNRAATRKLADTPFLFGEMRQPNSDYLIIPRHSSENRRYIPIGYMDKDTICGDANILLPNASHYYFGILMSNVHMAWMRTVCGRIKSDYRYSITLVYNNFPWPSPTDIYIARIEETAQAILSARALYADSSLADLYDEVTMPTELRKAHRANDWAVMQAYGFSKDITEADCVAELMKLYENRLCSIPIVECS